ncbi:LysR family transcriptional regulator [Salipiger marinus]|uniref:Transcriptional regulator n=1 Tax=Salipiger marinus TaxID=555512 RepID=A0A1G8PDU5_9RHOB|nr:MULTISPECIES: LysR family transcriptional regulator [Salipiger]HBM61582.1 LysR family transcriptional regulator [Citreicella sp.]MCD1618890.1 LysR family transcriptional regulator [Salipiger manganoxidans]MEB3419800.1 LysR family transcriptional regulator [Salipiger manganoxidans]SDI90683.1 transcriptional regulator [Salipiger marinus]HBS99433.1 LysR family transcriptional regulator [Citreicella sp.]
MAGSLTDLRPAQARLIAAIADHGQLQVAASLCRMTQPAASRLLTDLERQLGTKLFQRTPKGMEPTPAGALLARHARRLQHDLARLADDFTDLRTGRGGVVRVGAVTGPALGQLVPAVQQLKTQTPSVDVSIEVAPSLTLVQALDRGELDFVLARLPPQMDEQDFVVEPARDEIVQLLVRASHPLLDRGPVGMAALRDMRWILQVRGAPIRNAIDTAFHDAGLAAPQDVISTSSLLAIIALLKDSDAVAPMSKEVIDLMLEPPVSADLRRLELDRLLTVAPYLIMQARGRVLPRAAERLLLLVQASIRQM